MNQEFYDICLAHFNEPMLTDRVARCIGYAEDADDCYIIIQQMGGKIIWHTFVGGYFFLDRLRGQGYVRSTEGEDWDDLYRLDSMLSLNGAPRQDAFKLDLRPEESSLGEIEDILGD